MQTQASPELGWKITFNRFREKNKSHHRTHLWSLIITVVRNIVDECAQNWAKRENHKRFMLGTWFSFVSHFMPLSRVASLMTSAVCVIHFRMAVCDFDIDSRSRRYVSAKAAITLLLAKCSQAIGTSVWTFCTYSTWTQKPKAGDGARRGERVTKSFYFYTCLPMERRRAENFFVFIYFYEREEKNFYVFRRLS